jgi:hypothetical protein
LNDFLEYSRLKNMDCCWVLLTHISHSKIQDGKHYDYRWGKSDYQQHVGFKKGSTWTTWELQKLSTRCTRLEMETTWTFIEV